VNTDSQWQKSLRPTCFILFIMEKIGITGNGFQSKKLFLHAKKHNLINKTIRSVQNTRLLTKQCFSLLKIGLLLFTVCCRWTTYSQSTGSCMRPVACRDGRTGRPPRASKTRGHPKSEITKIKMLELDDFSYCKATNTSCTDLIFQNLFFCHRQFLHIQIPVVLTSLIPGTHTQSLRERGTKDTAYPSR